MYIELDHKLVPGKIEDINGDIILPGRPKNETQWMSTLLMNKYKVEKGNIKTILRDIKIKKDIDENKDKQVKKGMARDDVYFDDYFGEYLPKARNTDSNEYEIMAGTNDADGNDVHFDHDFGFFSAILACYNNHWVLKTSPDDWWNVIARNVAQMIDENGDKNNVRDFFVSHSEKKEISVTLPGRLDNIPYDWLFDQFSEGIRDNIKKPDYVNLMKSDFSTTTPNQLISTEIMLMSSLQKYFHYSAKTDCGIPGVEMKGTLQDWEKLKEKTASLEQMLTPIMNEIALGPWFKTTLSMLDNLIETFKGNPDRTWWSHILSWNETYGSGARAWWSGWMIDFLRSDLAERPCDFQSGVVSVPLTLKDEYFGPPVKDTGFLVAGTVGFKVNEGMYAPEVEAQQGWVLLLSKGSPVILRMRGEDLY